MSHRPFSQDAQQPPAGAAGTPDTAMDEALAEIERLRHEVQRLRQSLNDPLTDASDAQGDDAPARPDVRTAEPGVMTAEAGEIGATRRPGDGPAAAPPSEEDVLARLERLRQSIARARAGREQAVADFRDLVKPARESRRASETPPATASSWRRDAETPMPPAPAALQAAGDDAPWLQAHAVANTVVANTVAHAVGSGFSRTDAPDTAVVEDAPPPPLFDVVPARRRWPWLLLLFALAFVAGGVLYWLSFPQAPPPVVSGESARPTEGDGAASSAAPAQPTPGVPRSAADAASGVAGAAGSDAAALRVELRTTREAWIRVVVDGRRSLERLVAAGDVLTFSATTLVSVRAGDAGAVLVSVNGERAAPLGSDGQVATQSFAAPDTPGLKPDEVR